MPATMDVKIKDHFGGTATLGNYTTIIDTSASDVVYVGKAQVGGNTTANKANPVWQIKKIELGSSDTKILWADGNDLFDKVWDNRSTYVYR